MNTKQKFNENCESETRSLENKTDKSASGGRTNIPNHNPAKVIIGVRVPAPLRDAMSKEYKIITDNIVRLIEQDLQSQTLSKIDGCNIMSCFIRQSDSYSAYVFGKHKRTKERLYKGFHGFNTRTEAIDAAMNYIKNPE